MYKAKRSTGLVCGAHPDQCSTLSDTKVAINTDKDFDSGSQAEPGALGFKELFPRAFDGSIFRFSKFPEALGSKFVSLVLDPALENSSIPASWAFSPCIVWWSWEDKFNSTLSFRAFSSARAERSTHSWIFREGGPPSRRTHTSGGRPIQGHPAPLPTPVHLTESWRYKSCGCSEARVRPGASR